jgi:hypothetical protein
VRPLIKPSWNHVNAISHEYSGSTLDGQTATIFFQYPLKEISFDADMVTTERPQWRAAIRGNRRAEKLM